MRSPVFSLPISTLQIQYAEEKIILKCYKIDYKMKHMYEVWTHLVKNYFVLSGENISQTFAVNVFPNICCKSLMSNQ